MPLTTKPNTKYILYHTFTVDWICSLDFAPQEFQLAFVPLLYKQQSEGAKNVHGRVIQGTKAALCCQALEPKWQPAWIRVKDHRLVWRLFKPMVKRRSHTYTSTHTNSSHSLHNTQPQWQARHRDHKIIFYNCKMSQFRLVDSSKCLYLDLFSSWEFSIKSKDGTAKHNTSTLRKLVSLHLSSEATLWPHLSSLFFGLCFRLRCSC